MQTGRSRRRYLQKYKKILDDKVNQKSIKDGYPDPEIHRRNTGYAIDLLLDSEIFETSQIENLTSAICLPDLKEHLL